MATLYDLGGNTVITENIRVGATAPGQAGTDISSTELAFLDGVTAGTVSVSKAVVASSSGGITGLRRVGGTQVFNTAAAAAKTVSTTLTAAELITGMVTGDQAAGAAAAYTLPLGADLDTALLAIYPGLATGDSFYFSVLNLSTVDAEDITVTTNTGWTLSGDMVVHAGSTVTFPRAGLFLARKTGTATYTLHRAG